MITLFEGQDSQGSYSKFKDFVDDYMKKNPTSSIKVFDCGIDESKIIIQSLRQCSLFFAKECIVIKRIEVSDKLLVDGLINEGLKSGKEIIVWADKKVPVSTIFYKNLIKKGVIISSSGLDKSDYVSWIIEKFQKNSKNISYEAAKLLAEKQSYSVSLMKNEIDKLSVLEESTIDIKPIEKFVCPHIQYEIWGLISNIEKNNKSNSMRDLTELIDLGNDPMQIFYMIVREFRIISEVKLLKNSGYSNAEISRLCGLKPFVVNKVSSCSFSIDELTRIYEKLLNIDTQVKRSELDIELALVLFLKVL